MKRHRQITAGVLAAFGFLLLILDGQTAFRGAVQGIELCIRTVIPSLFPFFILSIILTGSFAGHQFRILKPLGKLLRMPPGSEGILLIGLLGGYPTGAQSIATAYRSGQLNLRESRRMMGFCSNAGPAFIFGMLAPMFSSPAVPWILWLIHIFSALVTGILLPGHAKGEIAANASDEITLQTALEKSVRVIATVCGWIVLFRVILSFLDRWFLWLLPNCLQIILAGILELSNGCVALGGIHDEGIRFLICSGFLGFGGLCVLMQTSSVSGSLGFGMYIPGKIIQTIISLVLSFLIMGPLYGKFLIKFQGFIIIPAAFLLFFLIFHGINSRNPKLNDV